VNSKTHRESFSICGATGWDRNHGHGIAGFFIDKDGQKLGDMKMRDTTLKFVIFPRPETYAGPLGILVDEGSRRQPKFWPADYRTWAGLAYLESAPRAPRCPPTSSVCPTAMDFNMRRPSTRR